MVKRHSNDDVEKRQLDQNWVTPKRISRVQATQVQETHVAEIYVQTTQYRPAVQLPLALLA